MQQDVNTPQRTKVVFSSDARKSLFKGLEVVADAVCATLGPRGRTVLIQQEGESPIVTKDGVTVSKSVKLKDPIQRMGAQLIKEAASQTNDTAGDGTTTSTVLTYSMVKSGLKLLEAGYAAKELCEDINSATSTVIDLLRNSAKQLTTSEEISQVATISANGDRQIGELIADAMAKVGHDGIITVEEAKGMTTSLEIVEGMQIDRGYLSPYFVTNSDKMHAAYSDAKILLVDGKVNTLRDIIPLLEKIAQTKTPLLIIADEVEGEALQGLVVNRVNGALPVVAIKSPGYGQHKDELLKDIAVLTGGKIVSAATGLKLTEVKVADLGSAKKVVVDSKSTTLVAGGATKTAVESHTCDLKAQMQDITLSAEELIKLRVRIAKLASGVALIKVGGATEVEMIERKYRIEDALHATRAAVEEGIVPGGGMALFNVWQLLNEEAGDREISPGQKVVLEACLAPIKRIAQNAGQSQEVIVNELTRTRKSGTSLGWNAAKGTYEDLIESGIIDPAKVTRTAIKNAASVATTFLSLDAVIVEDV
ncbi:MAG: chaperonin GroEL [Caulobacteraceae bacterium]|nr:chaperonin GroEL [Caulobacteraceae bacterium]